MLIHHYEAETHGFQGFVGQNDRGKAEVPKKSHFPKEIFFEGVPAFPPSHSHHKPQVPILESKYDI